MSVPILVLASTAAHASPLEPLWEARSRCGERYVAVGDRLVAEVGDRLVQLDRATGRTVASLPVPVFRTAPNVEAGYAFETRSLRLAVGDPVVFHGGHWFAPVDRNGSRRST